jgi:glyoxylase-like metal-dependent hydrolase (beta-lactamase superfamily II)
MRVSRTVPKRHNFKAKLLKDGGTMTKLQTRCIRMLFDCLLISSLTAVAAPSARGQGAAALQQAAEAMGGLNALRDVRSITRTGTVTRNSLGQGHVTSERLLMGQPTATIQVIDFSVPRQVVIGPRGKPTQVADWNQGGYSDAQGLALRAMQPGALDELKKEWDRDIVKFLVQALDPKSSIGTSTTTALEGKPHQVVTVRLADGTAYEVFLDSATHLISKIRFTEDRNPYGDLLKERFFSDYRPAGNVTLPYSTAGTEMGLVTLKQVWTQITVNTPLQEDTFAIPADLRDKARSLAHAKTVPVAPARLAEGVYFGEGPGMNSMWVEFNDYILVAEGPDHEVQSLETIRQIRNTIGNKPIRYLVTSHHHSDHTGGIRTYAGEGAAIVTHANNEAVISEILTLPHTRKPDLLATSGRKPKIETVSDRRTITDGDRTVELLQIPNPHANGFLAVYLPKEKLLFESDMFQILQGQSVPPRVTPETKAFYEAVNRAGWAVETIVPGHGRLLKWQDLVDAIKAESAK